MQPVVKYRSLAAKFSIFTAVLVVWVVGVILAYDSGQQVYNLSRTGMVCLIVSVAAALISMLTYRLMTRPLNLLQRGIDSVGQGRLEALQISRTGDEIERLGYAFNHMIEKLASSQEEIRRNHEQLEEKIRQRTEMLEETIHRAMAASQAKSEFLANMSHELRTPMSGVIGMIDLALEGTLDEEQKERLEMAQRCAHSLLALLNDLLDLSKIEAGRMALERIPFDLRRPLEDCIISHRASAQQKGIGLEWHVSPAVPRRVFGDPLRLRQILANLVNNAVKFTESGSVTVRLHAAPGDGPQRFTLNIEVADTGVGIPAEKLPMIFEKFTQADGSVSRRFGGTGLGLAITRKLVEMHGGKIWVESEPGCGSRFYVSLPYESAVQAGESLLEGGRVAAGSKETPAVAPARILVVEDNHVNQKIVSAILRKKGYEIEVADNGQAALDRIDEGGISLILMDVQMPVMDGLEATRQIRRRDPLWKLPIVAMTAHAMNGDRERCLEAGMNAYVSKPVHPAHLVSIVDSYLNGGRREQCAAEPIDRERAVHLMDSDQVLMDSMYRLFLQLAPERLEKLHAAAARADVTGISIEARALRGAAERIAAQNVAECASGIETAAQSQDYAQLGEQLIRLENELQNLAETAHHAAHRATV